MPEIFFPQFRAENGPTKYPFAEHALLTNAAQVIPPETLVDACLYPVGGGARLRLSAVTVTSTTVTLTIGDQADAALASGTFAANAPPAALALVDSHDRAAGLLLAATDFGLFASWGVGAYAFTAAQTEFAATCCLPQPAAGVRGIQLEDGTLLTGDVWLVGDDGVVLSAAEVSAPDPQTQVATTYQVIRVDVIGDPLFRRRLCGEQTDLFATPQFLKTLTLRDSGQTLVLTPGLNGGVTLGVNNALANDAAMRVRTTEEGVKIEMVGTVLQGVR